MILLFCRTVSGAGIHILSRAGPHSAPDPLAEWGLVSRARPHSAPDPLAEWGLACETSIHRACICCT